MKKLGIGAVAVLLWVSVGSGVATAEVTVGAGYQAMFLGDFFQGASVRAWVNDNWGFEGNIQQANLDLDVDTVDLDDPNDRFTFGADGDLYFLSGKIIYAPIIKENSKFYFGFEVGYGEASLDVGTADLDADVFAFGPLFGAEYRFQEIPELGFNWEVGYRFGEANGSGDTSSTKMDLDASISGITVCLGVHYYFN
ncbi:MAG: hypothetical protein KBE65_20350 [Phycisphaerae bacterium]|nr:hypothetical protein [Phycisphaerae bacterium]